MGRIDDERSVEMYKGPIIRISTKGRYSCIRETDVVARYALEDLHLMFEVK